MFKYQLNEEVEYMNKKVIIVERLNEYTDPKLNKYTVAVKGDTKSFIIREKDLS